MRKWIKSIAIKTIKTMSETALSFLTIGLALNEVDWLKILSVSAVAGIYTILFNLKEITIQGD